MTLNMKTWGLRELVLFMVLAYVLSFAARMIWFYWAAGIPDFYWNDQIMINTNDGYFFAAAVEYLLDGSHAHNPRVMIALESYPGVVYMTYLLAKFTPMSLDTVMLYMPAIVSSLVVIPIILTARLIQLPWVGFFASLLGAIVWSYYNRTMLGYFDTDMFSVLLQFTILYFFLLTIYNKADRNVLFLAFALLLYPFFYPQGLSLIYAIFILWALYQLVFQREETNTHLFIVVASVALWSIPIWAKMLIVLGVYYFLESIKSRLDQKKLLYLAWGSIFVFFVFGNVFALIFAKLNIYLNRETAESGLHFFNVIQTVREAGAIPWEVVANRIAGHPILLGVSIVGYIVLVIKHRPFVIAAPLIGVGLLAHWAGLRFTVYAVPVAALSAIYLFYAISKYLDNKRAAIAVFSGTSLIALYPNVMHIMNYQVPTVLNAQEIRDLDELGRMGTPNDYVVSWWDYGYPIWYYTEKSTLIDGSKHRNDNFVISQVLMTKSQRQAANLSRLAIETYAKQEAVKRPVIDTLLRNKQSDQLDPNLFLESLKEVDFSLPEKTREIYLYLPSRMLNIFPTIAMFSNRDLVNGSVLRKPFFYVSNRFKDMGDTVALGSGISFSKSHGTIAVGTNTFPLKRFVVNRFDQQGNTTNEVHTLHADRQLSIVYMQSHNMFIVMDEQMYDSLFIQMYLFDHYDRELFEPVVRSPWSKIYRLKI